MIFHKILETETIKLRAIEPEDVDLLFAWENDTSLWLVSSNITPFSKDILTSYIENSALDIYAARQLRLMVFAKNLNKTVGTIDLFDFDPSNQRAGVGIYVNEQFAGKGYATHALGCLKKYAKDVLNLNQLYAEMIVENEKSLKLFKHAGFQEIGVKKEWVRTPQGFKDQILLQLIF